MDMEKLTNKSREAMLKAQETALEFGHQEIRPEHLLYALLNQEKGLIPSLLKKMNVDLNLTKEKNEQALRSIPSVSGPGAGQAYPSREFSKLLVAAKNKAEAMKQLSQTA